MSELGEYKNLIEPIEYVHRNRIVKSFPFSIHEHFEIVYVERGSIRVTINENDYVLNAGDLYFATPFSCHRLYAAENISTYSFLLSPQICRDAEHVFFKHRPVSPVLRKEEIPPLVIMLLSEIRNQITERYPGEAIPDGSLYTVDTDVAERLGYYVSVILIELNRCMPMAKISSGIPSPTQKVLDYCANNFLNDISRDSLAEACEISTTTVSQIFAKMGTSFREYVNSLRINKAYGMLCTTDLSVKEIMDKCGYLNQGTFNQNFIRQYGKTPREIRAEKSL